MKIFICWSEELSRKISEIIRSWLPQVIQAADVFFSEMDIGPGVNWRLELGKTLESSDIGIMFCS